MDPRKLVYLATIIELGSLAKAAKALAISQPALTKSMNRLEEELGTLVLERGPTGIVPTSAGERIYAHARMIRSEIQLAQERVQGLRANSSVITFGTLPSLASSVVPLAVARWKREYPRTLLRVVEKKQIELFLGLIRGDFDFIVGQTEFLDDFVDGLKQRVLFRDELSVLARPQHRLLRRRKPLVWADLAKYPWIYPVVAWPQRSILADLIAKKVIEPPEQLVECGSIEFIKTLIGASDHLALLPFHSVASAVRDGKIRTVPIVDPALRRNIAVIFKESFKPDVPSQQLLHHIQEVGLSLSLVYR